MPGIIRLTGSLRLAADARRSWPTAGSLPGGAARKRIRGAETYAGPEGEGLLLPSDGVMQPLRRVRALAGKNSAKPAARCYMKAHRW